MAQVVWTESALDQLNDACQLISRHSPRFAEIFAQRVFRAADRLEQFPPSGRMLPEIGRPPIREVIVQNCRDIYRVADDRVEIVFVHHGARRLPETGE